ncbi:MAG: RnfH family protein [Gammaproteobacteria bacterium]|nr:RnfH family protein [Gammaproteobacteria bacterium]
MTGNPIMVEVAYATPEEQRIFDVTLREGATIREAVVASGVLEHFVGLDVDTADVGIFGKAKTLDTELRDGDRVEIYRPLIADPKEVRRRLAKEGKTMGRKNTTEAE